MMSAEQGNHRCGSSQGTTPRLQDLIPIAVVIAAGCKSCAERMVQRALRRSSSRPLIQRTLEIVAHLRSRDCFVKAVGPEVIARMEKPLQAGMKALREADPSTEEQKSC